MTREDIINMARDAGSIDSEQVIETVWNAFSDAERESCARLCEEFEFEFADDSAGTLIDVAKAIRARVEK